MFFSGKKKNPHEPGCFICHIVVSILLFLATIASLMSVLMSHYNAEHDMIVFGTNATSLSLIAFALTLTLWMKAMKCCMSGCEACGTMGKK